MITKKNNRIIIRLRGQTLIELLIVIGMMAIILPALLTGLFATRGGKAQEKERTIATALVEETYEAMRSIREKNWSTFAINGTYHPEVSGSNWDLVPGTTTVDGFTKEVVVEDVYRDVLGNITLSGTGTLDPSTKQVTITVSWTKPYASSTTNTFYLTRYLDNLTYAQTLFSEFNSNTNNQILVTTTGNGELQIGNNNKAKWCEPEFASSTIDLPDGPPVAVSARASTTSNAIPNDVFVATAPTATSSVKMAYVNVAANVDVPVSTIRGKFTLDPAQYSNVSYVPSGIGLDNNFKTNDVAYYTSSSNKLYALLATDMPDKEVIAVLVDDNNPSNDNTTSGEYQDPVNKIFKYKTYFNTSIYAVSETGLLDPSAQAAASGGDNNGYASNPTRAYTNNASYAVDTDSGSGTGTNCTGSDKDKHLFYNYNISVPSGASVSGIEVELDGKVDSTVGTPKMCVELSWDGGTSWTTALSTSTLTTSDATYVLGGAGNLWGRTWTSANLSNANFRMRISNVASNTSRDFSLDWAAVNIHYSGATSATNDQSPFGYGGVSLTVFEDRGYVASGGYLYAFDLSNIDAKASASSIDMLGCRIELDGFECQPGNGTDKKYNAGQTGTTWGTTTTPAHNDCSDGGNIELFATNDIYPVKVGTSTYIYAAVGAGTNPELNIANVTSIPTGISSPTVSNSSCGRITGGNSAWKRVGSYDFNTASGTEEAANSVFAKSDGSRAYISSNGGDDSKQFYIINTTNKSSPAFLSGANNGTGPSTGYYSGSGGNAELYPRRSLTVLNGQRVVLVGSDGITNGNDAEEYQVLNSSNEANPAYCSGINFNSGFNDLTSVVEADSDTFVYMVANTLVNELKIIQGGPDGTYYDSGNSESPTFDAGYNTAFNRYAATVTKPANTSVSFQFGIADAISGSCSGVSFNYTGPDGTSGTYYTATESAILLQDDATGYENPGRCFRYKTFLSTTDYNATPVVSDMNVNYSP